MKIRSIFLISVFLLSGCGLVNYMKRDSFYRDSGGINYTKVPLIKPYYVINIGTDTGWNIPLLAKTPSKSTSYYFELHDVRKISVLDGIIMAYTPYMADVDEKAGQKQLHWFVIIPSHDIEEGFELESDFLEYVQNLGITNPSWIETSEAARQFATTGCLDWVPSCK